MPKPLVSTSSLSFVEGNEAACFERILRNPEPLQPLELAGSNFLHRVARPIAGSDTGRDWADIVEALTGTETESWQFAWIQLFCSFVCWAVFSECFPGIFLEGCWVGPSTYETLTC